MGQGKRNSQLQQYLIALSILTGILDNIDFAKDVTVRLSFQGRDYG